VADRLRREWRFVPLIVVGVAVCVWGATSDRPFSGVLIVVGLVLAAMGWWVTFAKWRGPPWWRRDCGLNLRVFGSLSGCPTMIAGRGGEATATAEKWRPTVADARWR
jgi:hypothetical protein